MSKKENEEISFEQFKFAEFTPPGENEETIQVQNLSDLEDPLDDEIDSIVEANKKKASAKTEEESEEEEVEDVVEEPQKEVEEESTEEETEEGEISFKPLVEALAEKGILTFNPEDEFEDSDEGLEKVISETIKTGIESYKETLPEVVQELTNYIELGGDPGTFLQAKANVTTLENVELDSEDTQEKVVRAYLANQDWSEEDINEAIEDYKDSLILEKEAKRALTKLKKIAEKEESELVERQRQIEANRRKEYEDYISTVKTTITKSKDIAGLPISEKDKQAFINYLTKADREGKTEYEKDLAKDYMNNSLALAYFKFKNFNFESIEKKAEQKVVKSLKSKMFKPSTVKPSGSGRPQGSTSKSDLDVFKKIFEQTQ